MSDTQKTKYPKTINKVHTKEYNTWYDMLRRCRSKKYKEKHPTYLNVDCCEEWLDYDNFYEWLHSQENFKIWNTLEYSALDKDIAIKNNKIYSPDTCFLVPKDINVIFTKNNRRRGDLPIGVYKYQGKYKAQCCDFNNKNQRIYLGLFDDVNEAFCAYKIYKESMIKNIALDEYEKGTITFECYKAMCNYVVEKND